MSFPPRLLLLLALAGWACNPSAQPPADSAAAISSPSFDEWADGFSGEWARSGPQLATRTQYFDREQQDALDGQLSLIGEWGDTFGVSAARKRAELATRGLVELRAFKRDLLTPPQQLSAAVIEWSLDNVVKNAEFASYKYVFEQFGGLQLEYVNHLTQTHPIRQQRDVENYLKKLAQVGPRIDEGIAEARAADAAGIRPPKFIIERTMQQIDGFLKQTGRTNVFVATLDDRIRALGLTISVRDGG